MIIELGVTEFNLAVQSAVLRLTLSAAMKLDPANVRPRSWVRRMHDEIVGACGEIAFAKHCGRFLVPSVNTFHRVPDCFSDVELRATDIAEGKLIVRDNDDASRRYVLAIVDAPAVRLAGWMFGHEAQAERFVGNPHGTRPAWFVPQSELRPMETFEQEATSGCHQLQERTEEQLATTGVEQAP